MPRINSRKKGARGEKIALEVLEKWTNYKFHRVPQSGGLHWKNDFTSGDIVCGDALHRFDFNIEVKNYKDINFEHLLMPHVQCEILKFWKQCLVDADRGKKIPLLLMRYDGMKKGLFFAIIKLYHFKKLQGHLDLSNPLFTYGKLVIMNSEVIFNTKYRDIKKITTHIIAKKYDSKNG